MIVWQNDAGETVSVRFDAIPTVTHEAVSIVSDHPVEVGVDVTDNVRPGLRRVSFVGIVSNTPGTRGPAGERPSGLIPKATADLMRFETVELDLPSKPPSLANPVGQGIGALSALAFGGPQSSVTLLRPTERFDRVGDTWRALDDDARVNARVVSFVSPKRTYGSMLIDSVSVARSADSTSAWEFQVSLREIKIVDSVEVDAPVPAETLGNKPKAKGSQSVKDTAGADGDAKADAVRKSFLARGTDSLLGLL